MAKDKQLSIIDDGFSFEGTITFSGSLLVRGKMTGKLDGQTVTIAEEGRVEADVTVDSMTIGGRFDGELRARSELVILPTGSCSGKVECRNLVVQEGGMLNAHVQFMDSGEPPRFKSLSSPSKSPIEL